MIINKIIPLKTTARILVEKLAEAAENSGKQSWIWPVLYCRFMQRLSGLLIGYSLQDMGSRNVIS